MSTAVGKWAGAIHTQVAEVKGQAVTLRDPPLVIDFCQLGHASVAMASENR